MTLRESRIPQSARPLDHVAAKERSRPAPDAEGSSGRPDAQVIFETHDRSMTLATLGCLLITVHRRNYSAEEIALLHRHQLSVVRERGVQMVLLTILDVTERHIVRFDKAAREATVQLAYELAPHVCCSAVVFDRGGFAASAIRSLVTMIHLVSKSPFSTHIHGDLGTALAWVESKLDKQRLAEFDRATAHASVRTLLGAAAPAASCLV